MTDQFTIAIVDDHIMVRKGLSALINLFPKYSVLFDVGTGTECLSLMRQSTRPDIVLMDLVMPGMNGYEATRRIVADFPSVKVLALTTMDAESAILQMIRNGARGYILKDAAPADLKRAFDDVLTLGYYCNDQVSREMFFKVREADPRKTNLSGWDGLTDRELHFLRLICSDKTYAQIAKEMFVSERTVDGYRESLFKKLCIGSRVGLVIFAIKNQLVKI